MTALTIVGVLLGLAALSGASMWLHKYAAEKYHYKLFSLRNLLFMLIPIGLFYGAILFLEQEQTLMFALRGGNLDTIVMVACSAASLIGFIWYLTRKTNVWIALAATAIQFAAAVVIIAVVVAFLSLSGGKKRGR